MDKKSQQLLAEQFEANRDRMRATAYRMLGSASDAEDAVQESWLRLTRIDSSEISNLGGWLTTVVSRVCLDMLRTRKTRREDSLEDHATAPPVNEDRKIDPKEEAQLADSVGLAMLVVLNELSPAERIAFVLHDTFDLSFEEIAPIIGRTPIATRKLASRARLRVRGQASVPDADRTRRKSIVDAYLSAARRGDFDALMQLLDPDMVVRYNGTAGKTDRKTLAETVIKSGAVFAQPALVNGDVGIVVAPLGQLRLAIQLQIHDGKILAVDVASGPAALAKMNIALLET